MTAAEPIAVVQALTTVLPDLEARVRIHELAREVHGRLSAEDEERLEALKTLIAAVKRNKGES
jgi:hypothetical protein